MSFISIG